MNKRRQQVAFPAFGPARNGERGLTLIEILVALGILAAVAVIFLIGMSTSSKAVMVSQKSVAAESLAKSELEYIKSTNYINRYAPWSYQLPSNPPSWDPSHALPPGYGGYSLEVNAALVPGHTSDDGIQKITVIVKQGGTPMLTVVGYDVKP